MARAIEKLLQQADRLEASGLPRDYVDETIRQTILERRRLGLASSGGRRWHHRGLQLHLQRHAVGGTLPAPA